MRMPVSVSCLYPSYAACQEIMSILDLVLYCLENPDINEIAWCCCEGRADVVSHTKASSYMFGFFRISTVYNSSSCSLTAFRIGARN